MCESDPSQPMAARGQSRTVSPPSFPVSGRFMMPNAAMPQWRVPLRALGRVGDDNVRREIGVICAGARSGLDIIQRADHGLGRLLHMREDHRRLQTAVTDQQLEWPNVCPRRREVGGKATPQRISADVLHDLCVGWRWGTPRRSLLRERRQQDRRVRVHLGATPRWMRCCANPQMTECLEIMH